MRPALGAALAVLVLLMPPDRQSIVVARVFPQPGQIGLFIADADGSGERPLVTPADIDYDAEWSRDGKSIVFTSERNGSADLYRVNADGTGLERLTDSPAYDDQAAFSPDGKQLVFVSTRRRLSAILVAGRPMDRVLFRSRQRFPVRPRALGTSSAGRHLLDSSRRLGPPAAHATRRFLWQPSLGERQQTRRRVLHDG
jgi:dipeptidyl aminopeptidase/acylaminoacyl peptidase